PSGMRNTPVAFQNDQPGDRARFTKNALAVLLVGVALVGSACEPSPSPKVHQRHMRTPTTVDFARLPYRRTVYVPIYSDIFHHHRPMVLPLTATLTIRSTSLRHTVYVSDVDYYDTYGRRLRRYLDKPVELQPLESIEFEV